MNFIKNNMANQKLERLLKGEIFTTSEKGNSMVPLIKSGQKHVLTPVHKLEFGEESINIGDIVYCKVKGKMLTHLVKAKGPRGFLIGNNHGIINGWTNQIYGKVTQIIDLVEGKNGWVNYI